MGDPNSWLSLGRAFERIGDELKDDCQNAAENADVPGMDEVYSDYVALLDLIVSDKRGLNRQAVSALDAHYEQEAPAG